MSPAGSRGDRIASRPSEGKNVKTSRTIRAAVLAAAVALLAAVLPVGAVASANAADSSMGWVRVGHFSADTKAVDVQITPLSGGADSSFALNGISYGQVTRYLDMNAGTYAVSMRAAGSAPTSEPVASQALIVDPGTASTVAAYGPNAHLKTRVFQDDLTAPADGQARIRFLQVSAKHPTVSVRTSTGVTIATDVATGSSTGYASVPAGPWRLEATGTGMTAATDVSLANGSIDTLLVLDNAAGGVTLSTIVDSASAGDQPRGGVQTGGGWLASHPDGSGRAAAQRAVRTAIPF